MQEEDHDHIEEKWANAIEGMYGRFHRLSVLAQLNSRHPQNNNQVEREIQELQSQLTRILNNLLMSMLEGEKEPTPQEKARWMNQLSMHTQLLLTTNQEVDDRLRKLIEQHPFVGELL